jgi:hypothetical protein
MRTETITQRLGIAAPVKPVQLTTTTTVSSGSVDMSIFGKAFFLFETGVFGGTAPTLTAAFTLQESSDNATWTSNGTITGIPNLTAASSQQTVEVRSDQLGSGKRYTRLQTVCTIGGTSPTIPVACVAFGDEANHKPGNLNNDASVVSQTVQN